MLIVNKKYAATPPVEAEKAAGRRVIVEDDDAAVCSRLVQEVENNHTDTRLECIMLLAEQSTLRLLRTIGLSTEISAKADVIATTMDELLAITALVPIPSNNPPLPSLDREPVAYLSDRTVHLVVLGSSQLAEALAVNTALVAHYPNYCRDTRLRTRISVIDDDAYAMRDRMLQRYKHLFENSYYRSINILDTEPQRTVHRPKYEGQRHDFVDVEWEFVKGNTSCDAVRTKLAQWASSELQQLTVAVCGADDSSNMCEVMTLPEEVLGSSIPILCHSRPNGLLAVAGNIHLFCVDSCRIETMRKLREMAKRVNYIYTHCRSLSPDEVPTAPANIDTAAMEREWAAKPFSAQCSSLFSALTLGKKLHSVNITPDDWQAYYALSKDEIALLSEVEHNRWSVERLILGYRPTTAEETAAVDADKNKKRLLAMQKIHYDLRAFDELKTDDTGKNAEAYDYALTQGIPLIIKTCITD